MFRSLLLFLYIFFMLLCIRSIKAKEATQNHLLTTLKYVVEIKCLDGGSGSGVIIKNNKVLSAFHVSENTQCYAIDSKGQKHELELIKYDVEKDLVLFDVKSKLPVKGIRLANKQKKYDDIYTIGFPIGYKQIATRGTYQYDDGFYSLAHLPIYYGSSGGGVFKIENNQIKLVGVIHSLTLYRKKEVNEYSKYTSLTAIKDFLRD